MQAIKQSAEVANLIKYIIDCAYLDHELGVQKITEEEYLKKELEWELKIKWTNTYIYDDLDSAQEKYKELLKSPKIVQIVLTKWQYDSEEEIKTHHNGEFYTPSGAELKELITAQHRDPKQRKYALLIKKSYYKEITIGDWIIDASHVTVDD